MLTRPLRAPAPIAPGASPPTRPRLQVVLFSGGRGSRALAQQLVGSDRVDVTLVINGYDDGASTGEVRRFLGDCLGPSDFRKNASRVAAELHTAPSLIALVDHRLPVGCDTATATAALAALRHEPADGERPAIEVRRLVRDSPPAAIDALAERLDAFFAEMRRTGVPFDFSDCAIGNLVFAGCFLRAGRRFNDAVDDYGGLLGVPPGHLENVTDGANAYLVAIDANGALLASEAEIVSTRQGDQIREIFLVDRRLDARDPALAGLDADGLRALLARYAARPAINPRVVERIGGADLIIYAPGTQHSSLFPSYLTPGVSEAIAANLHAIKLLITNIQPDAEIVDVSAVDLIDRALFYLRDKGRLATPAPCLITHYLINDPASAGADAYVPLGAVESLEDPRLVRIGNYEDGVTGRHDASKVLAPFIASLLGPERELRVAVYLHDATSADKLTQSLLEMVRGGVSDLPARLAAFHAGAPLDAALVASLPFPVRPLAAADVAADARERGLRLRRLLRVVGHVPRRGRRRARVAARVPAARRGVGQPAPVGERRAGGDAAGVSAQVAARLRQLLREPPPQPALSGAVRTLHLRLALRRPRHPRPVPVGPARGARPQAGQPPDADGAPARPRGDPGDAGPLLPDRAAPDPTHDHPRRRAGGPGDRLRAGLAASETARSRGLRAPRLTGRQLVR